ncbi:ty3-gypsy retrotransposon protein [Cucumis melo var. makuwa]|uniref:Ty3-gypsy retrotransposon protein n=1 Tax=Cucumis melo var. makuwa TaxID=1194695 RepID=A0A5D3C895_CUCMM|nr:ty3-gypsy retrotransposon protein [Cucumis melo var. makuwa]TYK06556.1 ty3-gypsy retrotransposon protein [Cucumis melo var. makuwa]
MSRIGFDYELCKHWLAVILLGPQLPKFIIERGRREPRALTLVSERVDNLGRWKKMTQKMIEDRLTASEAEIEAIKQEDHQRQLGGSEMTRISTGKRKLRNEDTAEEEGEEGETSLSVEGEEGETSLSVETGVGQDRIKFKKLEMPVFNGEDPDGWFYRAEHYFQMHLLNERKKLKIVVVSLEGKGLSWFKWAENRKRFRSWKELKERMYNRSRSREHRTVCAKFLAVKQEGSVSEYLQRFEELSVPLPEIAEEVLEGTFTNGLDPIIRKEVFSMRAVGLEDMIEAAELAEEKIEESPTTKMVTLAEKVLPHPSNSNTVQAKAVGGGGRREHPYRRWTDSELQARKEKGLCYRCDEPFSKGHRCKNKKLHLFVVADDLDDAEMGEMEIEEGMVEVSPIVDLSLNSVVGLTAPGTFKIKGKVEEREVVVMIDCGATHNFISLKLVEELKVPTTETTNYGVIMGSGKAVQGKGMCTGVIVGLPGLTVVDDFLPLELGNLDMVLRIQSLQKQGAMTADWKDLAMMFFVGGTKVVLKGDPSLTRMEVSLKMLMKQ